MSTDPTTPAEAKANLAESIAEVSGLVVRGLGGQLDPPCVVIGLPRLSWSTYRRPLGESTGPGSASFPVFLVVPLDINTAMDRLLEFGPRVADGIEHATGATVADAEPGTFAAPAGDLPAYLFTAEYPLA